MDHSQGHSAQRHEPQSHKLPYLNKIRMLTMDDWSFKFLLSCYFEVCVQGVSVSGQPVVKCLIWEGFGYHRQLRLSFRQLQCWWIFVFTLKTKPTKPHQKQTNLIKKSQLFFPLMLNIRPHLKPHNCILPFINNIRNKSLMLILQTKINMIFHHYIPLLSMTNYIRIKFRHIRIFPQCVHEICTMGCSSNQGKCHEILVYVRCVFEICFFQGVQCEGMGTLSETYSEGVEDTLFITDHIFESMNDLANQFLCLNIWRSLCLFLCFHYFCVNF